MKLLLFDLVCGVCFLCSFQWDHDYFVNIGYTPLLHSMLYFAMLTYITAFILANIIPMEFILPLPLLLPLPLHTQNE